MQSSRTLYSILSAREKAYSLCSCDNLLIAYGIAFLSRKAGVFYLATAVLQAALYDRLTILETIITICNLHILFVAFFQLVKKLIHCVHVITSWLLVKSLSSPGKQVYYTAQRRFGMCNLSH